MRTIEIKYNFELLLLISNSDSRKTLFDAFFMSVVSVQFSDLILALEDQHHVKT